MKKSAYMLATIAAICGVLSLLIPIAGVVFAIAGLILSSKALRRIAKTKEDGRGLSIFALIVSVVGTVIQLFQIVGVIGFFAT